MGEIEGRKNNRSRRGPEGKRRAWIRVSLVVPSRIGSCSALSLHNRATICACQEPSHVNEGSMWRQDAPTILHREGLLTLPVFCHYRRFRPIYQHAICQSSASFYAFFNSLPLPLVAVLRFLTKVWASHRQKHVAAKFPTARETKRPVSLAGSECYCRNVYCTIFPLSIMALSLRKY